MNAMSSDDLRQRNLDIVLSGKVERNIQIASKFVLDDTFTALSKQQFLKLISLGVEIPLKNQTEVLSHIEPRFLDAYADLAKYTPKQIAQNSGGKYYIAEEIMQTTWSFWFDYLQKLKKQLPAKDQSDTGSTEKIEDDEDSGVTCDQITQGASALEQPNDAMQQHDLWDGTPSQEVLELVDDVWVEFVKAGMDK